MWLATLQNMAPDRELGVQRDDAVGGRCRRGVEAELAVDGQQVAVHELGRRQRSVGRRRGDVADLAGGGASGAAGSR